MHRGTTQVGIHNQNSIPHLRKDHCEIEHGRCLALARTATHHAERGLALVLAPSKKNVGAQHPVRLRVGAFVPFVQEGSDVLRDDTEDGRPKGALNVVNGLHAGVEILDKKRQAHTQNQADHNSQRDVQGYIRSNCRHGHVRLVGDFHGGILG